MATRLDRLFVLLDQGSSQVTRKAAAAELGEVQRLHPHELNNLLSKVRHYLHSSNWDTRIAAGQAVEAIVRNVSDWFPSGTAGGTGPSDTGTDAGRMTFALFNINSIIDCGKDLLASDGNEFDDRPGSSDSESGRERVMEQRRLLNHRLGLGSTPGMCGVLSEDLVTNEDLMRQPQRESSKGKRQVHELTKPIAKKVRKDESVGNCDISSDKIIDWNSLKDWPLEWFAEELMSDLFSPCWETRHGAATGLREIIKLQGRCAGRVATADPALMDNLNQAWLEDLALRMLCVLALDKFGDYVSDQVVAPVRETAAMAIGSVFHIMSRNNVLKCVETVIQLLARPEWEARHGGLLAMKYLLSIRQDMIDEILPLVFDAIFSRLKDPIDDVSAVAAAALVPVKDALIKTLPHAIGPTLKFLWDALLEIDDLTSSTSSILMLLSSLLTFSDTCSNGLSLDSLLPRLWPFMGHAMTAVRKSVLEAFLILIRKSPKVDWMQEESYKMALSLTYQRSLIENDTKVSRLLYDAWFEIVNRSTSSQLTFLSSNFVAGSICLMMHPAKFPYDSTTSPVWVTIKHHKQSAGHGEESETYEEKAFIGGFDLSENPVTRERAVLSCRIAAGKMLALLSEHLTSSSDPSSTPSPMECLSNLFLFHLNSKSSLQRMCIGIILQEWAVYRRSRGLDMDTMPKPALERCLSCLDESVAYDEISASFARLQQEVRDFLSSLSSNNILINSEKYKAGSIYNYDQITDLLTIEYPSACQASDAKLSPAVRDAMNERSRNLSKALANTTKYQSSLVTVTSSVLTSAVIAWNVIPSKLNPLIRPLMDCIRKEENESVQDMAAIHLSRLLDSCPAPAAKVVKNLVTFACSDPMKTPIVGSPVTPFKITRSNSQTSCPSTPSTPSTPELIFRPIIMLNNMQKAGEKNGIRRSVSLLGKKNSTTDSVPLEPSNEESNESSREVQITTRGATAALIEIVRFFGESLPSRIPQLWNHFTVDVRDRRIESVDDAQIVVQALQVIEITAKYLHPSLKSYLCELLPNLCLFAESVFPEVRHLTSRCMAALSQIITPEVMDCIVDKMLPLLASPHKEVSRQGSVECIAYVIESLGLKIVPYIVLLIVPMLARMSDQCEHVRLLATHCFAQLIQLMPLDNDSRSETLDRKELIQRKQEERKFLEQLMDPKKLENFSLPMPVKAELRSYQQQGVNWLAFLNRYNLHGILCDEMGLGKTLMSICILASDHSMKKASAGVRTLPSLVVCPPTLTGHWVFEVNKFVGKKHLNPVHYTGSPAERNKLKDRLKKQNAKNDPDAGQNLVVASYDIVRNDIEFFSSMTWNYCVLDEGHIIKNGKTKLSKAIKSLNANHRLILTGTPIQNNVLELWSLFDFLMPGFLGTEKQFVARFSRPILQSRDAKSSSKEQEAGVLAMDALHRQVLPFILRRMKEDVLKDLPPKIMQDYYCELSPLQARLYEDFAKSKVKQSMEKDLNSDESGTTKNEPVVASHIFQALQYLRKVCNHPKLVLTQHHPEFQKITSQLQQQDSSLSDINHATKLCALKQLLLDCGIGTQNMSSSGNLTVVNQHRALIFCQLKSMLDIVEQDLLKTHMSSVSYLRLDGSIPPGSRHSVVHRFNNDPSIDVLLLTTQVGGLGLNLTGADTVIFVEHDWNPMKDLQAMDRAHRIGQKKVVNVYRLVTTGTLEEKIMSLQKFKLTIANTVISQENSSLQTMATDQLLDLFTLDSSHATSSSRSVDDKQSSHGVKSVLESLPDLWEESAYESEYDLSSFIKSLR